MKKLFLIGLLLVAFAGAALAQNEQAPILEKDIVYKDWTYKDIRTGSDTNLRGYTAGKKLTIVVYFAPWCPNWRFDAPRLQKLYDKYKNDGLGIIAVGLYDPVASMKANLDSLGITFPAVYESAERTVKQTSLHYQYRTSTGDTRGWGSPWYIFLPSGVIEKKGDVITRHTHIVNGEVIEAEAETFIRKQLGLSSGSPTKIAKGEKIEECVPDTLGIGFKKPSCER